MTVRLLAPFNGMPTGTVVTLDQSTEVALVNAFLATMTLAGPNAVPYVPNSFGQIDAASYVLAQSHVQQPVLTGTLTETLLAQFILPANALGKNGTILTRAYASCNNNANGKTIGLRFGGFFIQSAAGTNQTSTSLVNLISNRNDPRIQVSRNGAVNGAGGVGNFPVIDTTVDQIMSIVGTLTNVGDTITLESWMAEVYSG